MAKHTEDFKIEALLECRLCADQFAATQNAHQPRPVFQGNPSAKILIAGQAPGARVHRSGVPFSDPSGDRLRAWMGLASYQFYDPERIAILPMAFCFPGYSAQGADLPPPKICAATWRAQMLARYPNLELQLLVGGYAQKWHLNTKASFGQVMAQWRRYLPAILPLPHPSWRNNAWLKKNLWFEADLLPELQRRVKELMR